MANAEHVAILVKGQEAWNRWRSVNVTIDPDLSGANLKTKTLSGFNLRRANLREADLSEAQLANSDLRGTNLQSATLQGAQLQHANARGADLSTSNLSRAVLHETDLREVNLSQSDLSDANLTGATLDDANLRKSNLSRADFRGARLVRADLTHANAAAANFSGASLVHAKIRWAALHHADFENAELSSADLRGVSGLECLILRGASSWAGAYRDEALACGAVIPKPPEDDVVLQPDSPVQEQTVGEPEVVVQQEEGDGASSNQLYDIVVSEEDGLIALAAGEEARVVDPDRAGREDEARREAIEALDRTEEFLNSLTIPDSRIGHNRPPEDARLAPFTEDAKAQLIADIHSARNALQAPVPDYPQIERLNGRFFSVANRCRELAGMSAEEATKAFGKGFGTTLGAGTASLRHRR